MYRIDRESNSMKLDTLVKEDDCDGEFGSMTAPRTKRTTGCSLGALMTTQQVAQFTTIN